MCAIVDSVCAHVCVYTISGEEKGKEGTELILSVYQKPYLSVIEFSPSSIVVVFVSGGWMVDFFFPLSQVQLCYSFSNKYIPEIV